MYDNEVCENCRFWSAAWRFRKQVGADPHADVTPLEVPQPVGGLVRKKADRGQCRRYAPRASALTTVWMDTRAWDWCGDYQPLLEEGKHAALPQTPVSAGSDGTE